MKPFQRWLSFMAPAWTLMACVRPMAAPSAPWRKPPGCLSKSAARSLNDPEWQYEGPIGPTGLGGSGRLNRVVPRPGVPDEWWACAPAGGLWRTVDGGAPGQPWAMAN